MVTWGAFDDLLRTVEASRWGLSGGPARTGPTPAQPRLNPPRGSTVLLVEALKWSSPSPKKSCFPSGKLTFRARRTVWQTHPFRAIKSALEIRQQLPRRNVDLFSQPPQTRIIKQNSKNSAIGAPKLERELRKSLKSADSSSGSEGRWPKTRTPARFAL